MKSLHFILLVCLVAAFTYSCTSDKPQAPTKTISPTRNGFASGEIAKYIKVVNEPDTLTFVEGDRNSVFKIDEILLKVKLRLARKPSSSVIPDGISSYDINFIYEDGSSRTATPLYVQLIDDAGAEITTLALQESYNKEIQDLLMGKIGDEVTVIFESQLGASKERFDKTVKFKPGSTSGISIKDGSDDSDSTSATGSSHPVETSASLAETLETYGELVEQIDEMIDKIGEGVGVFDVQQVIDKAEELSKKLDGAQNDLSESDVQKLLELESKMVNLSAKMVGKTTKAMLGM